MCYQDVWYVGWNTELLEVQVWDPVLLMIVLQGILIQGVTTGFASDNEFCEILGSLEARTGGLGIFSK